MRPPALLAVGLALASLACGRPDFEIGQTCELNTDCKTPFACRLQRCRRECVDSRDCGAGLACFRDPGEVSGGCQLPDETGCELNSECNSSLVCRFGECTTPCVEDRDCTDGQECRTDMEGNIGCFEPNTESCIYNSDCPEPFVCFPDQTCNFECVDDIDCVAPRVCDLDAHLCVLP